MKALEDQAAADEMDRILALTDAELDGELAKAGFDPKAERARGQPMRDQALRAEATPRAQGPTAGGFGQGRPTTHGARRRLRTVAVGAGALVALAAGVFVWVQLRPEASTLRSPVAFPTTSNAPLAAPPLLPTGDAGRPLDEKETPPTMRR